MNRADGQPWLKDGSLSFERGVDASVPASSLDRNQVAEAVNATFRGGVIAPRPGFVRKSPVYATQNAAKYFQRGIYQHGSFWDGTGSPSLISSNAGRIFQVKLPSYNVVEITPQKSATAATTSNFTISAVGTPFTIAVDDTSLIYLELPQVNIGGYILQIQSVDSAIQITVVNQIASQATHVVVSPATIQFFTFDLNSDLLNIGWSVQAENYWIYQDRNSYPIIFNGSSSRRSNQAQSEIPIGSVMTEAMGRILVSLPDGNTYRAGDLVFGSSGTVTHGYRDAVLKFTENNFLNEGGDFVAKVFGAPSNAGKITAMVSGAMTDTQLGQGPCLVGTPYNVFTVALPFDRTQWKNLANALQTVNPINGPTGQRSTVPINADVWYRSVDGIRSYITAQRQFMSYGNTPQSAELGDLLSFDTQNLLEHGSGVNHDNRLLMTVSPVQTEHGVYHRGLVSLDFNLVSTISRKDPPAWEGVWTGLQFLQIVRGMVDGKDTCFIYALNSDNHVELWEVDPKSYYDDKDHRISWSVDTCSYNCGDSDAFKKLETGRLILDEVSGAVDVTVRYRADLNSCWNLWDQFSICAKDRDCGELPAQCLGPHTYREQNRTPVKLRTPPDSFDPITGMKSRTGYEFQVRFEITGHCAIRQFRIYCLPEPEQLGRERTFS